MLRDFHIPALCCLALVAVCRAQQPSAVQPVVPEPEVAPPTLRITVTMIQVDAVVTNSSGKHIAGLLASDFEILQDGVPQKINYFSYVRGPVQSAQPETPPDPKLKAIDKVPIGPPPPITAAQVRRTVALVVDDLALGFEDLVRVREGLRQYVERQMQPGDLVAVVRTGGGIAILEQFTTDVLCAFAAKLAASLLIHDSPLLDALQALTLAVPAVPPENLNLLNDSFQLSASTSALGRQPRFPWSR